MANTKYDNVYRRTENNFENVAGKDQIWNGERFVTDPNFSIGMNNLTVRYRQYKSGLGKKIIFELRNNITDIDYE